jgi:hypothetical protein
MRIPYPQFVPLVPTPGVFDSHSEHGDDHSETSDHAAVARELGAEYPGTVDSDVSSMHSDVVGEDASTEHGGDEGQDDSTAGSSSSSSQAEVPDESEWAGEGDRFPTGVNVEMFFEGKPSKRSQGATFIAWAYDREDKALSYGATKYTISYNRGQRDQLDIDLHTDTALWRLHTLPIVINDFPEDRLDEALHVLQRCVRKIGCHDQPLEGYSTFPPEDQDSSADFWSDMHSVGTEYVYNAVTDDVDEVDEVDVYEIDEDEEHAADDDDEPSGSESQAEEVTESQTESQDEEEVAASQVDEESDMDSE